MIPRQMELLRRLLCGTLAASALLVAPGVRAVDLKIATVAPDGSHWMQQMRAAAEQVAHRTSDRVRIKFYPGGVMGDDKQVLRKIRIGQLQGGAFTASGLAERYPALTLYGIPLLFHSLDEVDAVRKQLDPKLRAGLEKAGFVSFGFTEGGFAKLLSNEPIHTVDDLRHRKVWVPEGDQISFLAMQQMGLSPVVLPVTDVLTGLQTGLIEVAFASPVVALVMQWQTKTKYITELPVSYSMGVFAIDRDAFERLSDNDRGVIREVMSECMGRLDRDARDDNRRAAEVLRQSGLQSVTVDASNVALWRASIEGLYSELRKRPDMDAAMFDELLSILADYRASHPDQPVASGP